MDRRCGEDPHPPPPARLWCPAAQESSHLSWTLCPVHQPVRSPTAAPEASKQRGRRSRRLERSGSAAAKEADDRLAHQSLVEAREAADVGLGAGLALVLRQLAGQRVA